MWCMAYTAYHIPCVEGLQIHLRVWSKRLGSKGELTGIEVSELQADCLTAITTCPVRLCFQVGGTGVSPSEMGSTLNCGVIPTMILGIQKIMMVIHLLMNVSTQKKTIESIDRLPGSNLGTGARGK